MAPAMRLKATRTTAAAQRAFACARQQALRAQASRHHVVRVSAVDGETAVVDTPKKEGGRKPGPLERGGTLSGDAALGKDPSGAIKAKMGGAGSDDGDAAVFSDARWINGTWDLTQFADASTGETDWDSVIDAEMDRRKFLEYNPAPSTNKEKVTFDTSVIPWWAWVRRFHLPEAEKVNGRAAMVGYFAALLIDGAGGAGLWEQQNSFFGKVLLHVTIIGIMLVRNVKDIDKFKGLLDEATFYDNQWNESWKGIERSEIEE